MFALILTLPFALAIFATLFLIVHGLSPLNRQGAIEGRRRTLLYTIMVLPLLIIPLFFSDVINSIPHPLRVTLAILSLLLLLFSVECSYFMGKTKKWYRLLTAATVLLASFFIEIPLIMLFVTR